MNINNNPYQQQMNSYMPQYPSYQYNQMGNMQQRYQPQQEFQIQFGLFGKVVQDAENIIPSDVPKLHSSLKVTCQKFMPSNGERMGKSLQAFLSLF